MEIFSDHRGGFLITNGSIYDQTFVSLSSNKFTFRWLHYQTNPSQLKTFKIVQGSVIDFIYNIETKEVKNFVLTTDSKIFTIGDQYAHGFLTLEPNTIVVYLVKGKYNPESEHSIVWNTIPEVQAQVKKHTSKVILSEKDANGK